MRPLAARCSQRFRVNTPSTPQTSLCPAPPGQLHLCTTNSKVSRGMQDSLLTAALAHRCLHHDCGPPAHCLGRRDQALGPAGVLGIKLLHGGCPLDEIVQIINAISSALSVSAACFNFILNSEILRDKLQEINVLIINPAYQSK